MQDGSSVPGITLADERPLDKTGVRKNSPFITSDDGDEDDKPRKPSVVHADDDYNADDDEIPEIKTEARTKTMARLKSNKTILKHNIISQAGGEYYHERMQRLQVLREEFCRVLKGATKDTESSAHWSPNRNRHQEGGDAQSLQARVQ